RSQYQDGRWVEIQPGMAIDPQGNFIVVTEPMSFRLASENYSREPLWIYLVIRHVDPDTLSRRSDLPVIQETFRIDEKNTLPQGLDLELCRILLPPMGQKVTLCNAGDPFNPGVGEPNFLHRPGVRSRPQSQIVVGCWGEHPGLVRGWADLAAVLPFVYPHGAVTITAATTGAACQLLWGQNPSDMLDEATLGALARHWEAGGTIAFEITTPGSKLAELLGIYRDLQQAIAAAEQDPTLAQVRSDLATEFHAIQGQILAQIPPSLPALAELAAQFEAPWVAIPHSPHPLRRDPFPFALLPMIGGEGVFIAVAGGLVLIFGPLSAAWSGDGPLPLGTQTLRAAQELGINLIHFAGQRQQMMQYQKPPVG
ncbi:MAG: hypothetical protein EA366_06565, partial [Spirulina sp. DLM2.Bin59]